MSLPDSLFGLGVLVALVLPGVTFTTVRARVAGIRPGDRDVSTRVLEGFLASICFAGTYVAILGPSVVKIFRLDAGGALEQPRKLALCVLILCMAVPAGVAYLWHGEPIWKELHPRLAWLRVPRRTSPHESDPTAWDFSVTQLGGTWVRVHRAQGEWVAGWYGGRSYVSTYPEPRDIYLEEQHQVDREGVIGDVVPGTAGVWLRVRDDDVVEWLSPGSS